ncbi:sel1 repeat family protein [Vibrio aestuarianus]|uniref:tetratricopeptide repeat protein n=1 Tax=Vibrio aestuarianus TaxID=28171 RepID=UPI0021C3F6E1|nr:tetratricopeptide repeat protein [Vibrio aestuarianus]MDE1208922.1 sel1 repeat family protein [Vibrio aestuarianus]MDE1224271.1 sel1 repeat family protein [Vibrio aestuarianus]MDE1238924.1 sel1 repeat family protein [Vibrio aestuarianus]MDE1251921.1 sel1 repeat family protein [Vibrio aestuarianus]MDE1264510.1 sel1 repeat family protein [Vibrio aestuarianus]
MSTIGIAIGATGLSLILIFVWMLSLSLRKKRLEEERKAREIAYRKAIEKSREQDRQDRLFKAETGHVPTILYLAKEAERTNIKEAMYWYDKAANYDNITGMYGVVRICQKFRDDLILRQKAKFWQTYIAGLEGNSTAKYETGIALVNGRGVEANVAKGVSLIEEAAEDDLIEAIIFMGDWCVSHDNIAPAPSDSTFWFSKAAKLNSPLGQMKLGLNYLKGVGVVMDHNKACYWLERASEKGNAEAMYHAGEAWIDKGPNGNAIAYIWLFLSAHFSYEPAKVLRDQIGSRIGVDSVVGLQSLAKPLMKKIGAGTVSKHSIIKALNKLYKRGIHIPQKGELAEDDNLFSHSGESLLDDNPSSPENASPQKDVPFPLDFSSTSIDR